MSVHKELGACSLQIRFAFKTLEEMDMPANMELTDAVERLEKAHGKEKVKTVVHAIPNVVRLPDTELVAMGKKSLEEYNASHPANIWKQAAEVRNKTASGVWNVKEAASSHEHADNVIEYRQRTYAQLKKA